MECAWRKNVLAFNIKFFRKELGLTQKKLAQDASLSLRSYQTLEAGRSNPTFTTIISLSKTFGINPSRLLQLNSVRIDKEFEIFLSTFRMCFQSFPSTVGLRTLTGIALWANDAAIKYHPPLSNCPLNITSFYNNRPEIIGMMMAQFKAEEKGIALPYLTARPNHLDKADFARVYPTLIYPKKGSVPRWAVVFIPNFDNSTEIEYFKFCEVFLKQCI